MSDRDRTTSDKEPREGSRSRSRPQTPPPRPRYSRNQWLRDAALIAHAEDEMRNGEFQNLPQVLSQDNFNRARLLVRSTPTKDRRILIAKVLQGLANKTSPLYSAQQMAEIARRLSEGPTNNDDTPSPRAHRPDEQTDPPPKRPRRQSPTRRSRDSPTPERRRNRRRNSDDEDLRSQMRTLIGIMSRRQAAEMREPRHHHRQATEMWEPPHHHLQATEGRESPRHHRQASPRGGGDKRPQRRAFKANILALDTDKTPISAYINQLNFLCRQYGKDQVLANIVPGIMSKPDSDGCQWFNSLDYDTQDRLTDDYDLWITLLQQRFRRDRGAIMVEADRLQHSFQHEDTLPLQAYIDKKIRLYNEAGDVDEDAQARRIWMGADPALAKLITPSSARMTVQDIKLQLTSREFAARRDWERQQQDLRDIRRLVDNRVGALL